MKSAPSYRKENPKHVRGHSPTNFKTNMDMDAVKNLSKSVENASESRSKGGMKLTDKNWGSVHIRSIRGSSDTEG